MQPPLSVSPPFPPPPSLSYARSRPYRCPPLSPPLLSAMHAAALIGGPLTFSWDALEVMLAGYVFVGMFGVSISYHRQLSHKSFRWVGGGCVEGLSLNPGTMPCALNSAQLRTLLYSCSLSCTLVHHNTPSSLAHHHHLTLTCAPPPPPPPPRPPSKPYHRRLSLNSQKLAPTRPPPSLPPTHCAPHAPTRLVPSLPLNPCYYHQ